jgi:hypothetical protein
VKAALLSALVPMTHSLLAAVHADWFTQHIRWWNGVSLYLCFFARMYLVGAHMAANEQPSGIVSSAAEGAAGAAGLHALQANRTDSSGTVGEVALPPQFAFHSFVVLVTSLIVHEDSLPWFATQLVGLAVLCRQGHLLLLFHTSGLPSMQTALQRFTSLEVSMQLPEYFIITGIALVLYKWLCVGMYGRRGRGLGSTATAGQLRREVGSNSSVSMNSNLQVSDALAACPQHHCFVPCLGCWCAWLLKVDPCMWRVAVMKAQSMTTCGMYNQHMKQNHTLLPYMCADADLVLKASASEGKDFNTRLG